MPLLTRGLVLLPMNGVLIVDKPEGITSHDVIWRARKILRTKSVGHTGTLDPFATGVLVILVGRATRLAQFLDKAQKEYLATIQFGFETETGDRTGNPKELRVTTDELQTADVESALAKFRGETWQMPPMYSAKKIAGKKLYKLARQGVEVERQAVKINISKLELAEKSNQLRMMNDQLQIKVVCSAGTYIRVLAEDVGRELKSAAHLAELRRVRAGAFDLSQSVTLDELEKLADEDKVRKVLISPAQALAHLPAVVLDKTAANKTMNGSKFYVADFQFENGAFVRMNDENNNLIAVGAFDADEKSLQPRVVLPQ